MKGAAAALALLLLPCAAGEALAQEPDRRAAAGAREAFERGVAHMRRERWAEGEAELRRSIELHPTQVALFNLAQCVREQGHPAQAIEQLERLLADFGDEVSAERRAEVEGELETLRAMPGRAVIMVDVDGAEILVDGRSVGTSPLPDAIELPGGAHDFEARLAGYASVRQSAQVPPEGEGLVRLELGDPQAATAQSDLGPSGIRPIFFWSAAGAVAAGVLATTVFGVLALRADSEYQDADVRTEGDRDDGRQLVRLADFSLGFTAFAALFAGVFYSQTDWSEGMWPPRLSLTLDSLRFGGTF